ncbi:MAG: type III-B CRISPR module RAMP protein Cmr4 [Verrucomicrobia bacterium]|nr:type III-B CRISPR module RAMP protein Cmr4 [Verrucomicrobiota bacterium]
MQQRLLYLFTRTPLHVGAGSSVGAIDQPIQRERHTGFPIIPASSLKGSFADHWNNSLDGPDEKGVRRRGAGEAAWLFGSDDARDEKAAAGALLFGEARLLAFPIRSARGSYAWITSPLMLRRAARDGVLAEKDIPAFPVDQAADAKALFSPEGPLALEVTEGTQKVKKVVLEEYAFSHLGSGDSKAAGAALAGLFDDPVWKEVAARLVILCDGQMSFFATTACEVAQHVRINDETGTADPGALFNQENVPSEALFYAVTNATDSRLKSKAYAGTDHTAKSAEAAMAIFEAKVENTKVFQFGGDASTGLGYCTVRVAKPAPVPATANSAAR